MTTLIRPQIFLKGARTLILARGSAAKDVGAVRFQVRGYRCTPSTFFPFLSRFLIPLQEFGIVVVGQDDKTAIHHKVAARAMCFFAK